MNLKHIAKTGINQGKWVTCSAEINCRNGGMHITAQEIQKIATETYTPVSQITQQDVETYHQTQYYILRDKEQQKYHAASSRSYDAFLVSGSPRSPEKLKALHGYFADGVARTLKEKDLRGYEIYSVGYGADKERSVPTIYRAGKNIDISVFDKDDKPKMAIEVKSVLSNYSQNAGNYFETACGLTAEMQNSGIPTAQIFILPESVPYFKRDGSISKIEKISNKSIDSYRKLMEYKTASTPTRLLFSIISSDHLINRTPSPSITDASIDTLSLSDENKEFLKKHSNTYDFLQGVVESFAK